MIGHPVEVQTFKTVIDSCVGKDMAPFAATATLAIPSFMPVLAVRRVKKKIEKALRRTKTRGQLQGIDVAQLAMPSTVAEAAQLGGLFDEASYELRQARYKLDAHDKTHAEARTLGLDPHQTVKYFGISNVEPIGTVLVAEQADRSRRVNKILAIAKKADLLPRRPRAESKLAQALQAANG